MVRDSRTASRVPHTTRPRPVRSPLRSLWTTPGLSPVPTFDTQQPQQPIRGEGGKLGGGPGPFNLALIDLRSTYKYNSMMGQVIITKSALELPGERLVSSLSVGEVAVMAGTAPTSSPREHSRARRPAKRIARRHVLVAALLICWTAPGAHTQSQELQWQRQPGRGPTCCSFGGRRQRLDATLSARRAPTQRACR